MGRVYDIQDSLRIRLNYTTDPNLAGQLVSSVKIKAKDQTGASREWTVAEHGVVHDIINKTVYVDLPQGSPLGDVKKWRFWAFCTMTDGRVIPSTVHFERIYEEGDV